MSAANPGARPFLRAGLVDSYGLAFGWTVFLLHATLRQGVGAAAVYQCAMFVGVAASAPFSRWVTTRLDGRRLIRTLAGTEGAARAGIFLLVLAHAPVGMTATVVVAMNVLAWTGYAAMRAEVVTADADSAALTRYALRVAASEAAAAATATLLPMGSTGALLAATAVYVAALAPTWVVAGGAVNRAVPRRSSPPLALVPPPAPVASLASLALVPSSASVASVAGPARAARGARPAPVGRDLARRCTSGGLIMFVAAGPSLMATVLSFHWYGRAGVLVSATSFSVGSLLSPRLAAAFARRERHLLARWAAFGVVMAGGWVAAPLSLIGLGLAQLASGAAQTAFEGGMDTDLAEHGGAEPATATLAYGSAARALGGAAAVAALPTVLGVVPLAALAAGGAGLLVAVAAVTRSSRVSRAALLGSPVEAERRAA